MLFIATGFVFFFFTLYIFTLELSAQKVKTCCTGFVARELNLKYSKLNQLFEKLHN